MTGTYMDDILGGSSNVEEMGRAKNQIGVKYRIKETEDIQVALGICLIQDRDAGTVSLSMELYFECLLAKYNLSGLKPKSTPFPPGLTLSSSQLPQTKDKPAYMKEEPYQEIVGALLFAAAAACPDIKWTPSLCSPGKNLWHMLYTHQP